VNLHSARPEVRKDPLGGDRQRLQADDIARPAGVPLLTKPFTAEQLARAIEEGRPR